MDLDTIENAKNRLDLSSLSKPALVGIAVILVLVAVTAGRMFLETATANQFEVTKTASQAESEEPSGEAPAVSEPSSLFVHVSGEVKAPGLCEVAAGSRVADAVQAAGGFTEEAAIDSVNLARPLSDGEQIIVANRQSSAQAAAESPDQASRQESSTAQAVNVTGLVNVNTASADQLKTLPGVGDVTAQKIIDDRNSRGPFSSKEDLKRVSGIGDKTYDKLAALICI